MRQTVMLIKFKSAARNDVLMFETAAKDFLRCIGKAPDEATGIITVDQLPAAIDLDPGDAAIGHRGARIRFHLRGGREIAGGRAADDVLGGA